MSPPASRLPTFSQATCRRSSPTRNTLPTVPETLIKTDDAEELAVAAINATVGTMRDVHEKVDAEDSASADILNDYIRRFEQQAWFIRSQNGQA